MDLLVKAPLAVHIVFGTGAVVAGGLPIFARKGKRFHRLWGRRFVFCMQFVLGSAVLLTLIFGNPYFGALTVTATITTVSGVRVLQRKQPDAPAGRARPLDWAVATGSMVVGALVLLRLRTAGHAGGNPAVVYALVGAAFLYGSYDLLRFARPAAWPFFADLWFYEHMVKMIGAYSAVVSAFSGSVAFRFLPDPWKQLWAVLLFNTLTLAMICWYGFGRRRRAPRLSAGCRR